MRLLERAIAERCDFAFEMTRGGKTITGLLERALSAGIEVRVWYVGLDTPELHIVRVAAGVVRGGHDIPEDRVERFDLSRLNLIRQLPRLTELVVYDNSAEVDPATGAAPAPRRVLRWARGKIIESCALALIPRWARPIMAAPMAATV